MTRTPSKAPAAALRMMLLIRQFETALAKRPDHGFQLLSSGEEAVAVGLAAALTSDDQLLTGGRSIGPALARGVDPGRLMAELLGRTAGTNKGKGGRGHVSDPQTGFFGAHAVVGGNITIAAGVALAKQQFAEPGIVAVLFGDGACGAGALHESLNLAAVWRLPLLFVCNNNQFSVSTPRQAALAPERLSDLGRTFGMPSQTIDGMDVRQVAAAAQSAADHVRGGGGPAFVEFTSIRFAAHSTNARETRSRAQRAENLTHCPIVRETAALRSMGLLNEAAERDLIAAAMLEVEAALTFADDSAFPLPSEALTDVV